MAIGVKKCVWCLRPYKASQRNARALTCSDRCAQKYQQDKVWLWKTLSRKSPLVENCVWCLKEFFVRSRSAKTCSKECSKALRRDYFWLLNAMGISFLYKKRRSLGFKPDTNLQNLLLHILELNVKTGLRIRV